MITSVSLVTLDDERRRMTEAVDRHLGVGRTIAQQAVRQAALADLLRELRRIELMGRATCAG